MVRKTLMMAASLAVALGLLSGTAEAQKTKSKTTSTVVEVDCGGPSGQTLQDAVDAAAPGTTIFVSGTCNEALVVTTDDLTISGNSTGLACDKADPSASSEATIYGSITVKGVRARLEFLQVTGPGFGVEITARASTEMECNDISSNDESGAIVDHASYALLVDNTFADNGQRDILAEDPTRYWDCGLYVLRASSVVSNGNTYTGNSYCGLASENQSSFRNGSFIPTRPGFVPDPAEKDVIIQRDCAPLDVSGCDARALGAFDRIAIESWEGGLVNLRHAEVTGLIDTSASSLLRVDTKVILVGDISNLLGGNVRIMNRNLDNGRTVSFTGFLLCDSDSSTYFSSVACGETCTGLDGNGNLICAP